MNKHEHYFKYTNNLGGKILFSDSTGPCELLVQDSIPIMFRVKQLHNTAANLIVNTIEDRIIQSVAKPMILSMLASENFLFSFDKYEGKLRCRFYAEVERVQRVIVLPELGTKMFWQYYVAFLKNHVVPDQVALEEPTETPSRYTIDERRVFISYELEGKDSRKWLPFLPWEHTLLSIDVKTMVVKQHHWVPGTWDNDPKYHGFLLQEEGQEALWRNQYPQAIFSNNQDHDNYQIRQDQASLEKGQPARVYEDVTHTINRLMRGIRQFYTQRTKFDNQGLAEPGAAQRLQDYEQALEDHLEDLILFVQTQTGCVITLEPLRVTYSNGFEEVLKDIPMAVLTFSDEETTQE